MRFLWISAVKDVKRRLADPGALALWLGIPILMGTLMSLIGGGDEGVPKARVLLADQDDTLLSRLVATGAGGGRLGEFLDVESVSVEAGRARMDAGDASALLILPRGFQDAVLGDGRAELTLVTNPSQRILPQIVEEGLDMTVEAAFYLQELLGEPLRQIVRGPEGGGTMFPNATIAGLSVSINDRVRRLQSTLLPPVISLQTPTAPREAPPTAGVMVQFMLPTILFMSLLFVAQGAGMDLWEEKANGTLRRALSAPHHVAWFLGGKLVAAAAFVAVLTLLGVGLCVVVTDITFVRLAAALVWCTFTGTALVCGFTFVQLLASTQRGANVVSTMVVFPLMMIGGSFFPFEAMPPWMVAIGRWTPNGLGVINLKALLFGQPDPRAIALAIAGIGLPAALAFTLSVRRARGGFAL